MANMQFLRGGMVLAAVATLALAVAVRWIGASPIFATIAYLMCMLIAGSLILAGGFMALSRKLRP